MKPFYLLFLLLAFSYSGPSAQARVIDTPVAPSAVIVLLPYSTQRVNTLQARGDFKTANRLREAQAQMRQHMVADFNDNFRYGRYYFAADSNIERIAAGDWNGLLLDASLQPINPVPLSVADSSILFVYQGYRSRGSQTRDAEGLQPFEETNQGLEAIYQSLILCGRDLVALPARMRRNFSARPLPNRKPNYTYYYRFREFDIVYNAAAAALSYRMSRHFGPPPAKP